MPSSAPSISTNGANCGTEPAKGSTTGSPASTCCRDHHLLEHVEARPRRLRQAESRPRNPDRVPGSRLAPGLGTHQPDRTVPLAKHRIHGPRETLDVGFRPLPQTTPDWLEPVFHHSPDCPEFVSNYMLMTIELGGFLSIAALLIGLFAWLRQDMQAQMGALRRGGRWPAWRGHGDPD